jgi:hypothetical protein
MDLTELNQQIALAGTEIQSLLGGKRASATRARKNLLLIKKQSDSLRRQVLEYSKNSKAEAKSAKSAKEVKVATCKEVKVATCKEAPVAAAPVQENKEEKPKKKPKGK